VPEHAGGSPACLWRGDAFRHLSGLTPCAATLLDLARPITPATWLRVRRDPAFVLLLVRDGAGDDLRTDSLLTRLSEPALCDRAGALLVEPTAPYLDFTRDDLAPLHAAILRLAEGAAAHAEAALGRVDPVRAWVAGLLAPLGRLVIAAVDPAGWAGDQDALSRHLARQWGLPDWLADLAGRLRLSPEMAVDLGAQRGLFEVVQRAASDAARDGFDLGLVAPVDGAPLPVVGPPEEWRDPAGEPLLADLLRLVGENRALTAARRPADLADENDRLHAALARRLRDEAERERIGRLSAVAELAAGAGHEINNPLAVISGRAQYLLAHASQWFAPEASVAAGESLETIIAQTRRIHTLLRQLMLFARPPVPRRKPTDVYLLVGEVARSLDDLAGQRGVRLEGPTPPGTLVLYLDPEQVKTALTALVRNAIEAAPGGGWVRLGVRRPGPACPVEVVVEDSGAGPAPEHLPHLFDPFFSGREAGRGKGLGLPVAWQLVRQHGGEVRYARPAGGPTRFAIVLPAGLEPGRDGPDVRGEAA